MITAEMADVVLKEIKEYGKQFPGRTNGEDFTDVARALAASEAIQGMVTSATAIGMLSALMMLKKGEGGDDDVKKILKDGPVASVVMDILYLGIRLGRAEREISQLDGLASNNVPAN